MAVHGDMPAKADIARRVDAELSKHIDVPTRSTAETVALAARILAREKHFGGLAGQCTVRGERPGTYWTLRLGVGFDEATPDSLVLVDDDLKVLEGSGMPNPATRFHTWVYRARPDVQCILHTHPPAVSALSMLKTDLVVAHMDATPFYENCAWLPEWPGLPIADDEGRIISEALGSKSSLLLAHHGLLTAGRSIEEATYLAVYLERAADLQLRAAAAGQIRPVPAALAEESRDFLLKPVIVSLTFAYWARQVLRDAPDCLERSPGQQPMKHSA